jgi:hypothetical protein
VNGTSEIRRVKSVFAASALCLSCWSPSDPIRSFLTNTTEIAFRLLLALLACGTESGIPPLIQLGARVDSLLKVTSVQGQLAGPTEGTLLEGKLVNRVKIGEEVSYTPFSRST